MDTPDRSPLSQSSPLGLIQHARQLSIPLWVRMSALAIALATFTMGLWLIAGGVASCHASVCDERMLEIGSRIVTIAFLPSLVLVYVAFAQTGVSALTRKSRALLADCIPGALLTRPGSASALGSGQDIIDSSAQVFHSPGVPSARYRLALSRKDSTAELWFQVDFNVSKVNITVHVPWTAPFSAQEAREQLEKRFPVSFEGARDEGYTVDNSIARIEQGGRLILSFCIRRRLAADFLWDSAGKLYFAQDLRYFLFSLANEGWELFQHPRKTSP